MLIDARHPEETRVAVIKGNRIEEFDFESAEHKQIKGNIYLAKVTRVEPSLQAAFIDFGGNRHGFLAFNEIHPDYYQIPKEDRDALLAEEAEAAEEEARLRAEEEDEGIAPGEEYDAEDESSEALAEDLAEDGVEEIDTSDKDKVSIIEDGHVENGDDTDEDDDVEDDEDSSDKESDEFSEAEIEDDEEEKPKRSRRGRGRKGRRRQGKGRSRSKEVDEVRARRLALRRRYKIQDVIQRRQVLLVQVVKEERGNKGAALTTYLSLAGRYTVLMPNSSHGGGISRKINSSSDRKRLKQIVSDLKLPKTMGLIVRTAGLSRTKTEIKRDFDYLARLWDEIREMTLSSTAPTLIHSDSDLIKRAIRDIYNREIEEVVVEGEEGYKAAKEFMKLLMPSHARRVKAYTDPVPLYQRYGAEDQLRAMYDPVVQLKSGGYLVINPTEALVSIDINSGRSTKEHGIEQTALSTNLEAAREIARQLRLRDMAGLVVIDFIDMEYNSNTRKVEKAMKEALKHDRARLQVGRISGFGLMEMSRQRLRTGVLEATTRDCPHCDGTGLVRTASSAGLSALRLIEDEAAKGKGTVIRLGASTEAAIYMLNTKRGDLAQIEDRYGVTVEVVPEGEDEGAKMTVTSMGPRPSKAPKFDPIVDEEDDEEDESFVADHDEDDGGPRKKRRRRRRGGRGRNKKKHEEAEAESKAEEVEADSDEQQGSEEEASDTKPKKRRRRGAQRKDKVEADGETEVAEEATAESGDSETVAEESTEKEAKPKAKRKRAPRKKKDEDKPAEKQTASEAPIEEPTAEAEQKPKRKRAPRKKKVEEKAEESAAQDDATDTPAEKPKRKRAPRKKKEESESSETKAGTKAKSAKDEPAKTAETDEESDDGQGSSRRGWWQRTFGE